MISDAEMTVKLDGWIDEENRHIASERAMIESLRARIDACHRGIEESGELVAEYLAVRAKHLARFEDNSRLDGYARFEGV